ncbi:MAG: hypothetical protein M1819_005768 [Sarea resinae]|nr:MAG: hypothetical protein M1819_005768 [Sarea resinae]
MTRDKPELNEYELQRQANIAKNQALLRELQLSAAAVGLQPKAPSSKSSAAAASKDRKRKRAPVKKEKDEFVPRRTSSRLAGIVADSEVAKRKAEEEHDAFREAEKAKRQRVSGDLDLSDIVVTGKQWDKSGNFIKDLVRGGRPYERTFTDQDVKETTDKELRQLREKMSGLELWEGFEPNRIKVTPERIYSMAFHPTPDKPLVFAGDKLGNLGLFDGSQTAPEIKAENTSDNDDDDADEPEPSITTFKLHSRTISAMHFPAHDANTLYTASYDSSIRKFDLAASRAIEAYAPASADEDEPLSGVEVPVTEPHMLYFSSLEGRVGRHDTRTPPPSSTTELFQLSEKKIGGFSLHPSQPHLLATASLDRSIKLWDLRQIKRASSSSSEKLPLLVGEHYSALSVSHAAFNAQGQVATSSYDDTIKVYDVSTAAGWTAGPGRTLTEEQMEPVSVIRHNNQTGRWVTILRPQYHLTPLSFPHTPRFVIGNMNRFVDIYTSAGEQLAQLGGDGITAVPAVAVFHPALDWVAGGTASGKLCLWM